MRREVHEVREVRVVCEEREARNGREETGSGNRKVGGRDATSERRQATSQGGRTEA